ncbi:MAG: hypothetical protein LRY40_09075 [Shewanella fodinae]|nr:hypothetical protein [Shewanella fodinae]
MLQFAEVALPVPMRQNFTYQIPTNLAWPLEVGMRVRVPFGRQQLIGLVVNISDECALPPQQLKAINVVLDSSPLLSEPLYKLTLWAARYYYAAKGKC